MSEMPPFADDFLRADEPPPLPRRRSLEDRLRSQLHQARRDADELRCIIAWLAGRYHDTFPGQFKEAVQALDEMDTQ